MDTLQNLKKSLNGINAMIDDNHDIFINDELINTKKRILERINELENNNIVINDNEQKNKKNDILHKISEKNRIKKREDTTK